MNNIFTDTNTVMIDVCNFNMEVTMSTALDIYNQLDKVFNSNKYNQQQDRIKLNSRKDNNKQQVE